MRNVLLINGSPRGKGTSVVLLELCRTYLAAKGFSPQLIHLYPGMKKPEGLYQAVAAADTIVFCGPSYINTYPADTTAFFEALQQQPKLLHGQSLYGIIQGGMPYVHTHICGLSLLKMFCKKCNMTYRGGFVMGLGAYLNGRPVTDLPHGKKVLRQLNVFFEHIAKDEVSPPKVYEKVQLRPPSIVGRVMSLRMNHLIDKDLAEHGIDIRQKSPYLGKDV